MSKLKLFADRRYLENGRPHVTLLIPFWGKNPTDDAGPSKGRYDDYAERGRDFFSLVPLAEADIAVLPFEWRKQSSLGFKLAEEATRRDKKVLIFFNSDSTEPIPVPNAVIFRTSFFRSKRKLNEHAIPAWSEDFLKQYLGGRLPVRRKSEKPMIGYAGYIDSSNPIRETIEWVKDALFPGERILARRIRGDAIRALEKCGRVRTNFLLRRGFMGGCGMAERLEYVENLVQSDYALVARGAGNFSYRLYEALSCGRIPVVIDTDCVFPCDHIIDWKQYCVWVDQTEVSKIGERVADFHHSLSADGFEELQRRIRALYEQRICPTGFFSNLRDYLRLGEDPDGKAR